MSKKSQARLSMFLKFGLILFVIIMINVAIALSEEGTSGDSSSDSGSSSDSSSSVGSSSDSGSSGDSSSDSGSPTGADSGTSSSTSSSSETSDASSSGTSGSVSADAVSSDSSSHTINTDTISEASDTITTDSTASSSSESASPDNTLAETQTDVDSASEEIETAADPTASDSTQELVPSDDGVYINIDNVNLEGDSLLVDADDIILPDGLIDGQEIQDDVQVSGNQDDNQASGTGDIDQVSETTDSIDQVVEQDSLDSTSEPQAVGTVQQSNEEVIDAPVIPEVPEIIEPADEIQDPESLFQIYNSDEASVETDIKIYDQNNNPVNNITDGNKYDVKIYFNGMSVKELEINDLTLQNDDQVELGVDEIEDADAGGVIITGQNVVSAFAVDPSSLEFTDATLKVKAEGSELYECDKWNFEFEYCTGEWQKSMDLVPGEFYNINLDNSNLGYAEVAINIINVQSYPVVGGDWEVRFTTTGSSDLTVRAIDGTTWSDTYDEDLKFLEIRCGDETLNHQWKDDSVFIENYDCSETGYEISKVMTSGKHDLEFKYGDMVVYAHNDASNDAVDLDFDGFDNLTDCNDTDITINPNATEICGDLIDQDCIDADLSCIIDNDNDTYDNTVDCNDDNNSINPGAVETCNLADDDCNGNTDEGYDQDADNYFVCSVAPDCDDADSLVNPGKTEIPFNNLNDDCNDQTLDNPELNITVNKEKFNISEQVEITLKAPNGSTVILTVNGGQQPYSDSTSGPFPITYLFSDTTKSGTYNIFSILSYLSATKTYTLNFEVKNPANPLSVLIVPSNTTINKDGTIWFDATILGNTGAVTYKWDFENDGIYDSIESKPSKTYAIPGSYIAKLFVSDGSHNATDTKNIQVRKKNRLEIVVEEASTAVKLSGVNVSVANNIISTNGDGIAAFELIEDEYSVSVSKEGYFSQTKTVNLNTNISQKFTLEKVIIDSTTPNVELIEPSDGKGTQEGSIKLRYRADDNSVMSCSIYTSPDEVWWKKYGVQTGVNSGSEKEYLVQNLEDGDQYIKVECSDGSGNTGSSRITKVVVGSSAIAVTESETDADTLYNTIQSIIDSLNSQDLKVKEFVSTFGLDKELEKYKLEVKRIKRDLFNLKFKDLSSEEIDKAKNDLTSNLNDIESKIPASVKILETREFIKYPNNDEISAAIENYLKKDNPDIKDSEIKNIAGRVMKMQGLAIISTKATSAQINYMDAASKIVSFIDKSITFEENDSDHFLIEYIPKDIVKSTDDIKFISQVEIVEKDPLIKFEIDGSTHLAYYIEKKVDLAKLEAVVSLIMPKQMDDLSKSPLTGFAIFGFDSLIKTQNKTRVLFELIIVAFLVLFYFLYPGANKDAGLLKQQIDLAKQNITIRKYDAASENYKNASKAFSSLPPKIKGKAKPLMISLHNEIDALYISNLVDQANGLIKEDKKRQAYEIYFKMRELYKKISKDQKLKVHQQCDDLYKKLNVAK